MLVFKMLITMLMIMGMDIVIRLVRDCYGEGDVDYNVGWG